MFVFETIVQMLRLSNSSQYPCEDAGGLRWESVLPIPSVS